jgi:hypothetical protein
VNVEFERQDERPSDAVPGYTRENLERVQRGKRRMRRVVRRRVRTWWRRDIL